MRDVGFMQIHAERAVNWISWHDRTILIEVGQSKHKRPPLGLEYMAFVDRACPSLLVSTLEFELLKKFREFARHKVSM